MLCLPRIRGGVSHERELMPVARESSPHTRGCFRHGLSFISTIQVFPAYAGVFLGGVCVYHLTTRLPRIRGGVSPVACKEPRPV